MLPWWRGRVQDNAQQIVALLALDRLGDRSCLYRGLDSVLNIRDVDLEAGRRVAVHSYVQVRLTDYSQQRQIHDAGYPAHNVNGSSTSLFEYLQVFAVYL